MRDLIYKDEVYGIVGWLKQQNITLPLAFVVKTP